jgi:hypothetical protein
LAPPFQLHATTSLPSAVLLCLMSATREWSWLLSAEPRAFDHVDGEDELAVVISAEGGFEQQESESSDGYQNIRAPPGSLDPGLSTKPPST